MLELRVDRTEAPGLPPVDALTACLNWRVPYLTGEIAGTGGVIRDEIEDFVVDEVPAYEPCGEGEHTYFRVEKRGIPTLDVIRQVASHLGLGNREVSCAGFKDARAVARQTFSVHFVDPEAVEAMPLENARVLWVTRHRNKLRTGHLRGNRFTVRIREVAPASEVRAAAILEALMTRGVPNAYGPQRFGHWGVNHIAGYYLLRDARDQLNAMGIHHLSRRMRRFMLSALQSALFNQIVARRIETGTLDTVILGDVAKKEDTGGIFTVENPAAEQPRAAAWEISATGPIFGYKMMTAQAEAGEIEREVLVAMGLDLEDFRPAKARGLRRPLRYNPEGLTWSWEDEETLVVSFFAPKGAFATMLLAELMKSDDIHSRMGEDS
jgi:tRNA pseudouridine13 synthase